MARPLKQIVDYFPHMVTHGKTLLILRNEFGNDGYAFWFSLLELLCKTDGQFYDYNKPAEWRLLLAETHVAEEKAQAILKTLAELESIDQELYQNKIIWSQNLVDNLDQVYDRRTTGKPLKPSLCEHKPNVSGIIANNNNVSVNILNPPPNSENLASPLTYISPPLSKQNNTKQNKSRGNKVNVPHNKKPYGEFKNVFLTDDEYQKLKERFNNNLTEMIESLSTGIESHGYKYKSHYATILNWARRDEKQEAQNGRVRTNRQVSQEVPGNRPAGAFDDLEEDTP